MNQITGNMGNKKRTIKPSYTGRQLDNALIAMYEDLTRFVTKPVLTGQTAEQAKNEGLHKLTKITAVIDKHQVTEQLKRSFDIIHPEVKFTKNRIKFESQGVPVDIDIIDLNNDKNRVYRNPVIQFFLVTEVYVPNR